MNRTKDEIEEKEKEKNDKPFNVILLGKIQSDKEAILRKLIKKRFAINQIKKLNKKYEEEALNSMEIHGETIKMKIWDNTSANKVFSYSNKGLKSVQGIILFYSVCDRNSFNMVKSSLHKIMDMNKYDFPMVLVGNDSESPKREVNYEEAKALADSYGLSFYEVSINTGVGIQPMFEDLGEQVVYREYQCNKLDLWKNNNKSVILNGYNNNYDFRSQRKGNKNISLYTNKELYDDEFNKSLKERKSKNLNAYTLSSNKHKQTTNYKTGKTESVSDLEIEDSINKTHDDKAKSLLISSSSILNSSSSVIYNYQGSTAAQKKREEEIRLKRLKREKEMKTWWKQREKENFEMQKKKKIKEKNELKIKIKEDKKIQKEKEKKAIEENLIKIKLNYEQKKKNNTNIKNELIAKKENLIKSKMLQKKNNKEMLNKLKEEREIEQQLKEKEKLLLNQRYINKKNNNNINNNKELIINNNFNSNNNSIILNQKSNKNKKEKLRSKSNKIINKDEEEENEKEIEYNYETKEDIIENYKKNSNIFRCLKCNLIPDIIINEYNQEIEIYCDHYYYNKTHHNIISYSNFIEQSLNHPIDINNIFCTFCKKYANELSDDNNIFFCEKCNEYFCDKDNDLHYNLRHKNIYDIKDKYLRISKDKIIEKNLSKKNSKMLMTPMQNKYNKIMIKQNTTPYLLKKANNKIISKTQKNELKDTPPLSGNNNIKKENIIYHKLPFSLIDSYCGIHEQIFKFYCFDCHKNFCELCQKNHSNHNVIKFDKILLSNEELNSKKNELNKAKENLLKLNDYFGALIEAIKCKFERLFNIKKKEIEIKEKIIEDYETIKYNYHSINNIRNIIFDNNPKFLDLSPNTNWLCRFNSIFQYLNSDLTSNDNDIFEFLNNRNEKNSLKIISQKNDEINKLILLKNNDIAISTKRGKIIIYDKDKFNQKMEIKISENNNINDIKEREGSGLLCCGYEFIKFINIGIDNNKCEYEYNIKDINNNINSVLEFNNNIILSVNDYSKIKLWKKNNNCNNKNDYICSFYFDNVKQEITDFYKIGYNTFITTSKKENLLCKFIINKYDELELKSKLENIFFSQGKNYFLDILNDNFFIVACYEKNDYNLLLIDKKEFIILKKFIQNYPLINLYYFSNNNFISLDSNNHIYKLEFDKEHLNLFFDDEIKLNNKYILSEKNNNIDDIVVLKNKNAIVLTTKNQFIKIFNY